MSALVGQVEGDLAALGDLGGPEVAATVTRLVEAARPALRSRYLDAVNALVQEYNAGEEPILLLSLNGDHIHIATQHPSEPVIEPPTTNDLTARIALRVSEEMKQQLEESARSGGMSVNSWIVRALDRSLHAGPGSPPGKRRLQGYGRA